MKAVHFLCASSLILFVLVGSCGPQGSGSSADSGQEVGEARYHETYRPQFHFSPDSMWMNDPNGMVYYEGEYHLFYQHHPHSNVWGPMHWGHAISTDLVHWEHLPIALYPDSLGTIFSGSAVIDWKNSSGLGTSDQPPMVAIFTHHNQKLAETGSEKFQYQSIAYSLDKGRSWTKYPGNPVVKNPGVRDFRDPKVSWMEDAEKWIMTLAAHDRIMFYSSPDLINWNYESEFGANTGAHGGVWECPDLFPLEVNGEKKWVLLVSINPGGPNGGSATQYFVGEFDGSEFHNENPGTEPLWLDYGKDNYAGVSWSDIPESDGRRLFMGWMSNWQYANQVPTELWRSAMTLPRELKLSENEKGYRLNSLPVEELKVLREERLELQADGNHRHDMGPKLGDNPPLFEMDLVFTYDPAKAQTEEEALEFGITLKSDSDEFFIIGFNTREEQIFFGRQENSGKSDFSEHFSGVHAAPYQISEKGEIRFHAFIDLASVELFVDDGAVVLTDIVFPEAGYQTLSWYRSDSTVNLKRGDIYRLKRSW